MPDLTIARRFNDTLAGVLDGYTADLQREWERTRARLAEALAARPLPRAVVRREFDALSERAAGIGRDYEGRVTNAVEAFVAAQLEGAGRFGEVADMDAIRREFRSDARRAADDLLGGSPMWVDQFEMRFSGELGRMRLTGEDRAAMVDRLMSVEIVDGRASVARSAKNSLALEADLDLWTFAMGLTGMAFERAQKRSQVRFQKQAIAAIDHRTTDCCLRVHGQVQPLNSPFVLTGKPRFANRLQGPPFHWRCRTAITLYTADMENVGVPTSQMQDAARAELRARLVTGTRVRIWPSHATSRR